MAGTANQADSKGPPVLPAFYNAKTIRSGNQMKTKIKRHEHCRTAIIQPS
jgi:hypothetical protein